MTAFTADAARALGGPDWLVARRVAAADRFAAGTLPTEAEEIWRYSGIDRFELDRFVPSALPVAAPDPTMLAAARTLADSLGERSALVVTHNGWVLAVEPGSGTPADLVQVAGSGPMAQALPAEAFDASGDAAGDAFGHLHEAFLADAVIVSFVRRVRVGAPVVVVHLCDSSVTAAPGPAIGAPSSFPLTVVKLEEAAEGGVVEVLAPVTGDHELSGGAALVVPVSRLEVGDGASLAYANLQVLGAGTTSIGLQASRIGAKGSLRSFTVGLGGSYARVRTDSSLVGEGGHSALLAAYLGVGAQVHDFRTLQDHHAPRTDSLLQFTGAVADEARSVYSGLIRIRRGARRSDARQTNNNLVLSEGAHADSVPNLDIDENDVKCSHASTVGPIDEEQRYYLESRGIEPAVAERLIVGGFFADLAGRSPFAEVGRWVEQAVEERLVGRLPAERRGEVLAGPAAR